MCCLSDIYEFDNDEGDVVIYRRKKNIATRTKIYLQIVVDLKRQLSRVLTQEIRKRLLVEVTTGVVLLFFVLILILNWTPLSFVLPSEIICL